MFNSAFDGCGAAPGDYYPEDLRAEIDTWNARIYGAVNNGVYKAGFATSQEAYESAFFAVIWELVRKHAPRRRQHLWTEYRP